MKIYFWLIGKSTPSFVTEGITEYEKRIKRYIPFEIKTFPPVKNAAKLPPKELKKVEAEMLLKHLKPQDKLIVLDEHGKDFTSVEFSNKLENWMATHSGNIIFLVGGAYGIHQDLLAKASQKIALGKATYSHQIIRIMFMEQLYRACTIIKGEKYHNE
jgi:23S rRNA (pseudouridine1915-N3)-methyltransferase